MSTFNYASRDYNTIKTDLLARADRVMPEWTDRDSSDFGMMMVDLWSMMGDVLHYYTDRAATEAFLSTATQRESVLAIANLLDYKPVGRTSASGTVTVQNTNATSYVVTKDTQFIARANDKTYFLYVKEDTTVGATSSVAVAVGEGEIISEEILTDSSSGLPGQKYTVSQAGCAPATVRVDVYEDGVNAVPYAYVKRLALAESGARVYTTQLGPDNFTEILFGSTTNGFVPPTGASINVTYASCSGSDGNLAANAVTGFEQTPITGISVASSTALSGGVDEETIASMKQSIPSVLSVQDRAVTSNDFKALAVTVPGVAKAALEFTPGVAGPVSGTVDKAITAGIATVTVTTTHGFLDGDAVRVDNMGVDFDGVHIVSAPTTGTFTFTTNGADLGTTSDNDGACFKIGDATAKMYVQEVRSDYLTTGDSSQTVSTSLRSEVESTLQAKALLGVNVTTAATIGWDPIDVTATVYVNDKAVTNTVSGAVSAALDELFAFDNVFFGQLLHLGQVHRIILNVPGVNYVDVTKFALSSGGASQVDNSIQITEYRLPKKGTYGLTYSGGISTS